MIRDAPGCFGRNQLRPKLPRPAHIAAPMPSRERRCRRPIRREHIMKLHMNPVTTTSRPILLLLQDEAIPCDLQIVDLMAGEHKQEPYISLNPLGQIPTLEDGDLMLTESSAILKYIADKFDSTAYPKELKARAKVNEMMDWFNTSFSRNYCYGLVYAQIMPAVYGGRSDESRAELLERGRVG